MIPKVTPACSIYDLTFPTCFKSALVALLQDCTFHCSWRVWDYLVHLCGQLYRCKSRGISLTPVNLLVAISRVRLIYVIPWLCWVGLGVTYGFLGDKEVRKDWTVSHRSDLLPAKSATLAMVMVTTVGSFLDVPLPFGRRLSYFYRKASIQVLTTLTFNYMFVAMPEIFLDSFDYFFPLLNRLN